MRLNFDSPTIYLRFVHALSLLVPAESRPDWRREWEAEIVHRWQVLQKWGWLNMNSKMDLTARVAGATRDVATFQQNRARLVLVVLNILVALALGFGAGQEFVMGGILGGKVQPFLLSLAALVVSVLFIISAIAMLRQWPAVRRLVVLTGVLSMLIHIYGALPPHRNMGYLALLIGAGYALVMMLAYHRNSRRDPIT
ncbi:MAG TPA: hypothetical protein VFX97_10850 [Pyrinomonadaceae bacterium]|nr:hypothetical protein [Pyrinomonadaceae bacterium]